MTLQRVLARAHRACGRGAVRLAALGLAALIAACSQNSSVNIANSQSADPTSYPIFYVKRTIPPTSADLRLLLPAVPAADLYMRATASPSAAETNITARLTAGASYDVKDVDTSFDGTKVAFAMRGVLTPHMHPDDAPSWRIHEHTIATNTLAPMMDPASDPAPDTVDDVSPHYLPDGRIVFSSTRQLPDEGLPQLLEQDEDRTEPTFNLHVVRTQRSAPGATS